MTSSIQSKGPWSELDRNRFLDEARIPIRIAASGNSGYPVLASLWYIREGDLLWCATQRSSSVARLLANDPRCGFEVSVEAPPYRGVRGRGWATLHDDRGAEILRRVIDRYLGTSSPKLEAMLLARAADETAIAIEPRAIVSWDYQQRMSEVA